MKLRLGPTLVHVLVDVALDCGPQWLAVTVLILVLLLLDLLNVLGLLDLWSICGRVWDAVYVAWVGGGLGFAVLLGLLLDVLLDFHLQLQFLLVGLLSWYDHWVGWWNGMHWLIIWSTIYRNKNQSEHMKVRLTVPLLPIESLLVDVCHRYNSIFALVLTCCSCRLVWFTKLCSWWCTAL